MAQETKNTGPIRLRKVRLSFPNLFIPKAGMNGKGDPKYNAHFILYKDEHAEEIKMIKQRIALLLKERNGGKKLAPDRYCLRDGESKPELDGYGDEVMFISTSSKKKPVVVDSDHTELVESSGKPYAGCFVDCTFDLWFQNHAEGGKRVNAQLRAVRFNTDGDAFGSGPVDADEEFGEALAASEDEELGEDELI